MQAQGSYIEQENFLLFLVHADTLANIDRLVASSK
jgi:hypothetical protein